MKLSIKINRGDREAFDKAVAETSFTVQYEKCKDSAESYKITLTFDTCDMTNVSPIMVALLNLGIRFEAARNRFRQPDYMPTSLMDVIFGSHR